MKTITLLLGRLKTYIVKNKVIFILFLIGGIINSMMFAYMYGNLRPIMFRYNSQEMFFKKYTVFFTSHTYIDQELNGMRSEIIESPKKNYVTDKDVQELIDSGLFETIMLSSRYNHNSTDPVVDTSVPDDVQTCAYGYPDQTTLSVGTLKVESTDLVINAYANSSVGHTIEVRGRLFNVVGRMSGYEPFLINPETYKEMDVYTNAMELYSAKRWHLDNDVPLKKLYELFPNATYIKHSTSGEAGDIKASDYAMKEIIISYSVTFIAFVFLLEYLSRLMSDENAVSLIVGGKPVNIMVMTVAEGTALSFVSILIGLIMHALLYRSVFSRINISDEMTYGIADYSQMLFVMLMVSIALMIVRSIRYIKITPFKLRGWDKG